MRTFFRSVLLSFALLPTVLSAAPGDTVIFTPLGHFYYDSWPLWSAYSPLIDRMGRPYIYAASVELGMVTFDFSNTMNVVPVDTITPAELNNEIATFCAQVSNYLFVASGRFQSAGQRAGLSIYDVTVPSSPVQLSHWDSAAFTHGASQVVVQGNYAYLSAMDDGVLILDISNVNSIQFVSQLIPSNISCANVNRTRGLFISHDTLLATNDCGGLRMIDVTNKYAPMETGAYKNPGYGTGVPYYNHVWRLGDHAYIPVDYCGFEVDNVSDPANITNEAMWNPWNCTSGNWGGADLHTNEIVSALPTANVLMVSGGDSQVLAFDPSNPAQPRLMGAWGPPNTDSLGAWGIDVFGNYVVAGYIHTPGPFYSSQGGIQLLSWNLLTGTEELLQENTSLQLYPNPATDHCTIALPATTDAQFTIEVFDVLGNLVKSETADPKVNGRNATIDLSALSAGVYTIRVSGKSVAQTGKVVKQ